MKEIKCKICPNECQLEIEVNGDDVDVTGNMCHKGYAYGISRAKEMAEEEEK